MEGYLVFIGGDNVAGNSVELSKVSGPSERDRERDGVSKRWWGREGEREV